MPCLLKKFWSAATQMAANAALDAVYGTVMLSCVTSSVAVVAPAPGLDATLLHAARQMEMEKLSAQANLKTAALTADVLSSELFEPEQLRLIRQIRVRLAVDRPKPTAHTHRKVACRHVDILRFDHQRSAASLPAPGFAGAKQRGANPGRPLIGLNANIPQDGRVSPPLQHLQASGVERDHRATDPFARVKGCQQPPVGDIETLRPARRPLTLYCVIVLDPRHLYGGFVQPKPTQTGLRSRNDK